MKPMKNDYVTYLYRSNADVDLGLPEIAGKKCVAISWGDVFEERDAAMELIAKIASGDLEEFAGDGENDWAFVVPEDIAMKFLTDRGYANTYGTLIRDKNDE